MPFETIFLLSVTPFYIIIILTEMVFSHFAHKSYYTLQDTLHNILFSTINMSIDVAFRLVYLGVFYACYEYRLADWQNPVLYWACLLILQDLCFYFLHYLEHISHFFWAVHVTHHSSEKYNLTTGFRSSVLEPLYRFIFFLPLIFLGFRGQDILLMYAITQVYGILVHTQYVGKLGFLEHILVTPSHHRVHHASNIPYLDKNMGMLFIVWDKLFGTFQPENIREPIRYGLVHNIEKNNFFYILFHEWINIAKSTTKKGLTFKQRWHYVFGRPGWSHDGSSKTSGQLQKELKEQYNDCIK